MSTEKFKEICPSLVQQIESGVCAVAKKSSEKHSEDEEWKRKTYSPVLL